MACLDLDYTLMAFCFHHVALEWTELILYGTVDLGGNVQGNWICLVLLGHLTVSLNVIELQIDRQGFV